MYDRIKGKDYFLSLIQLARYSPTMVVDSRACIRKFKSSSLENVVQEC